MRISSSLLDGVPTVGWKPYLSYLSSNSPEKEVLHRVTYRKQMPCLDHMTVTRQGTKNLRQAHLTPVFTLLGAAFLWKLEGGKSLLIWAGRGKLSQKDDNFTSSRTCSMFPHRRAQGVERVDRMSNDEVTYHGPDTIQRTIYQKAKQSNCPCRADILAGRDIQ